ncbi:MAG: COX15/CtaA family protein, partial [Firmicutes bacterium]|nr:COX15/CtaA family protein [Bacillota bacterium]
ISLGPIWTRFVNGEAHPQREDNAFRLLRIFGVALLLTLILQLTLGAAVRHAGAALAIPDFPTSYGQWLPPVTVESLNAAMAQMPPEMINRTDYTPTLVLLHFVHRLGAVLVCLIAALVIGGIVHKAPRRPELVAPTLALLVVLGLQIIFGIATVASSAYPEVATMHQFLGAMLLSIGVWLTARLFLITRYVPVEPAARAKQDRQPSTPLGTLKGQPA